MYIAFLTNKNNYIYW